MLLDGSLRGIMNTKLKTKVKYLVESMAQNEYNHGEKNANKKGILELKKSLNFNGKPQHDVQPV